MAGRNTFDYKVLIVTLGKVFVGKTSLSVRYVRNTFDEYQLSTVGALHLEKIVQIDGNTRVKVEIWDTAGAEQYESLTQQYWRNANGAVVVYDVSQAESFDKCKSWVEQLRDVKGRDFPIVLVGNKADLPPEKRVISLEQGQKYAQEQNLYFEETSARTGQNVEKAFNALVAKIPIPKELSKITVTPVANDGPKKTDDCKC